MVNHDENKEKKVFFFFAVKLINNRHARDNISA